jgi:hypothetical protein
MAHAVAHLDLEHHNSEVEDMTDEECNDADGLARLRLDEINF